jgi:zinc protease
VRESYPVPDTPGTIYYIGKDKEMPNTVAYLMFKHDPMPEELKGTVGELVYNYITDMVASMLNSRFNDMMSNPDAPFAVAQADMGQYLLSSTEDMFAVIGAAKEGDIRPTLQSIYREVLRAKRGGFTQSEYDRARSNYLTQLEQQYNNRNHQETSALVTPMVRNFIENTALCSIDTRYETIQLMSQAIDLATINQLLESMVTDDNRVVLCFLPDAENSYIPTKMELSDLMRDVDDEQIDAFVDNVREDPLIPSLPKPGTITATTTDEKYGFTEWTLSNGAKVIIKPTEFKNDEIVFQAFAHGGKAALIPNVSVSDYKAFDIFNAGIGEYSNADLTKYLSGKNVDFTQSHGNNAREFDGSTTPKDLPTLMELIYGYFTAPNYTEDEFAAGQNLYYGLLHNQELNPQFAFQRALVGNMFTSPYRQVLTADDVKNATREGVTKIAKNMVANAADYTFTFVGNVDVDALRPLVEQYIATLPANAKKASKRVTKPLDGFTFQAGSDVSTSTIKMETPQTYASVFVTGSEEYSARNSTLVSVAGQILTARLLKTIREEMGAVYSISAQGSMSPLQPGNTSLMTTFPMNPEQKDTVLAAIKQEFDNMATQVTDEELNKVKEFMVKSYTEDRERNSAWADDISTYKLYGVDKMFDALNEVSAFTPADVQNFVKELLSQGNYRVVILDPEQ